MIRFRIPFTRRYGVLFNVEDSERILPALDLIERRRIHHHHLTLDDADFEQLVRGRSVDRSCTCRDRVAVILADIGYEKMMATIGVAQARSRDAREVDSD